MKQKEWNEGMDHLDPDLVEIYVEQKDRLRRKSKKPTGRWLRVAAVAACLALVIGAAVAVPMLREDEPGIVVGTDADTTKGNDRPDVPTVNVQAPSLAPQYYGSESSANSSLTMEQAEILVDGISVTARLVETLPDTYTFFDDWRQVEFRLLRMEVITVLEGASVPSEFLFIVPVRYMTDYSVYDKLVFRDIGQYSYGYSLVYNKTRSCAEQLEMVVFGYMNIEFSSLGVSIKAFRSDGRFDMRLWYSTEGWKTSTHRTVEYYGTEYYHNYTLQDAEDEARNSRHGEDYFTVRTLGGLSDEAADALAYIKSFDNGIYVPTLGGDKLYLGSRVGLSFSRFIAGFATNEGGTIFADSVHWSQARFTKEDEQALPNLGAGLTAMAEAFEADELSPPHIRNADKSALKNHGIFGWYAKTANGIIGVIRVTWCYQVDDWEHYYDNRYYDDAYYIMEYGSDECKPIDRDDLLEVLGDYEKPYIYTGEYDEYGKVRDMYAPIP